MSTQQKGRGFWITNRVANPVLRPLLRGPLGHRLGRRLAVVRYRGRRTGEPHELVVQYVRDGEVVWIVPGHPDQKRWWRSLLEPQRVEVWLAGVHLDGVASVIGVDTEEMAGGLAAYRTVFSRVAQPTVMVRVEIAGEHRVV